MTIALGPTGWIHLTAALWVLIAGALQLARSKGTLVHRRLGHSWMVAMLVVATSSFWLKGFKDVFLGFSPIHLLSLWVIFCVVAAVFYARASKIRLHRAYVVGAYLGSVAAGLGAVLGPQRVLHAWLFGP